MREGEGNCLKYLKRTSNKTEGRGYKDFKSGGQAGSRGVCLKKGGGWNPLTNYDCSFYLYFHLVVPKTVFLSSKYFPF